MGFTQRATRTPADRRPWSERLRLFVGLVAGVVLIGLGTYSYLQNSRGSDVTARVETCTTDKVSSSRFGSNLATKCVVTIASGRWAGQQTVFTAKRHPADTSIVLKDWRNTLSDPAENRGYTWGIWLGLGCLLVTAWFYRPWIPTWRGAPGTHSQTAEPR